MGLRASRSAGERGWTCPHTQCWVEAGEASAALETPEWEELGGRRAARHRDQADAASRSWSSLPLPTPACPLVQHSCKRQRPQGPGSPGIPVVGSPPPVFRV